MRRLLPLLALCVALLGAPPLPQQIEDILASGEALQRAHWGLLVTDLATGRRLYERNSLQHFVPASNAKLFTTALALSRLGPEHRFRTRVRADRSPDEQGVVDGDLRMLGGGDPTMGSRPWPYRKDAEPVAALQGIDALADQIVARGVKRVRGRVLGDDTAYVWAPYPTGWAMDDGLYDYGAPVSALTLNDNVLALHVRPGASAGLPAAVSFLPAIEFFTLHNGIGTVAAGSAEDWKLDRSPGSREVRLWGTVTAGGKEQRALLAVDDPARFAAMALHEALQQRGVVIEQAPAARHRPEESVPDLRQGAATPEAAGVELASRMSAPLAQVLQVVNKVSQNLYAELLLREVGRVRRHVGSREAGLEEMQAFLTEIGIDPGAYRFRDGSGLSRLTLVSPSAIVRLLTHMAHSPQADVWLSTFPVGGEDGTLAARFVKEPAGRRVQAKTGSLSYVSALSGYATTPGGERRAFAVLVNNAHAPATEIRAAIDRIGVVLAN